jgi:hypothetical protein
LLREQATNFTTGQLLTGEEFQRAHLGTFDERDQRIRVVDLSPCWISSTMTCKYKVQLAVEL